MHTVYNCSTSLCIILYSSGYGPPKFLPYYIMLFTLVHILNTHTHNLIFSKVITKVMLSKLNKWSPPSFTTIFICTLLYFHHHVWIKLVDELIQLFDQRRETWSLLWIQFPALQHNGITARTPGGNVLTGLHQFVVVFNSQLRVTICGSFQCTPSNYRRQSFLVWHTAIREYT